MGKRRESTTSGAMGRRLSIEDFDGLTHKLAKWRLDPDLRLMEAKREKGRILAFVKGLRLSAEVAYLVRQCISGLRAEVSWGHLVDDKGESCSPECDVIIHHPGCLRRWNGRAKEPIMDFKFIECSRALAVISCKSLATVDKAYCKPFADYGLTDVLLFAECCQAGKEASLKKQALAAGYRGFYYLYTLDGDTVRQDEQVYLDFTEMVRTLVSRK